MTGAERRAALSGARLYLCSGIGFAPHLDAALGAGVDVVQLREKRASRDEIADAANAFRRAARAHGALFILNDDPSLAAVCGADGVHVGQQDMDPAQARAIVGEELLVGRSTHSQDEIARALEEPVDYLGVGPVNQTPTKPGRAGVGSALVTHAATVCAKPFFVTGGMDASTIPVLRAVGAQRFVVVRAITEAADVVRAVGEIRAAIDA